MEPNAHRKPIATALLSLSLGLTIVLSGIRTAAAEPATVTANFHLNGTSFEVFKPNKGWQPLFLKGVNIGVGKPGRFPGELAITKAEYARWLTLIGKMNANTIRVYTTQTPAFYEAFFQYNRRHPTKPLYLIQGVWINEDDIGRLMDPYLENEKIKQDFIADSKALIDVVHGQATIPPTPGHAGGSYMHDISRYVIAWILGIEWDPVFVTTTNANHPEKLAYDGRFVHTESASPFEVFLAEVADATIGYESDQYATQRPLSFTNWPTTDMLSHPNEPLFWEDRAEVNLEHLKAEPAFLPGLFAAYHVYPYYPDFMNYQHDYAQFIDTDGLPNAYKAYLRDLRRHHDLPVLVAEFGVPSARGKAHDNIPRGFNQGNITEQQQGDMDAKMLTDIRDEQYAGGLLFAWQDEWFKRTWNTMDLDIPDQRPYWSNAQTNEQEFGLLAFDPGKKDICRIDGRFGDWRGSQPFYAGNGVKLHARSDEKYVYLMAEVPGFDFSRDTLVIPVDTLPNQGSTTISPYAMTFATGADFVITLHGRGDSRISVEAYYDSLYFLNAIKTQRLPRDASHETTNNGLFVPMKLCLNRELYLPQDQVTLPFSSYETGKLHYGDGNPAHADFDSLTDFAYSQGKFEMRIPWQLLNVMDPSTKKIMGNFYSNDAITPQAATGFRLGAAIYRPGNPPQSIDPGVFDWNPWGMPTYHERLKRSYYTLRKALVGF